MARNSVLIYIVLIAFAAIFLFIQYLTHIEFMLHVAAIPLEILVAVFVVERFLKNRQDKERRRKLMHIKSCMFRLEMRNLYITNFIALKSPPLTMSKIKSATLAEMRKMREDAKTIEYKSLEDMEPVIMEYVRAEPIWRNFMYLALEYNFEEIFQDMVYIIRFISDVKTFKECNPQMLFIYEAANNEPLMNKVVKVLGGGIRKLLDYAIELKEKQPELFYEIISDYELSIQKRTN